LAVSREAEDVAVPSSCAGDHPGNQSPSRAHASGRPSGDTPEAFQQEVERRAATFRIKLRSIHIFSRIVNLLASLTLAPFFLSVLVLFIGLGGVLVRALVTSGYAGEVFDQEAFWFMPLWYTTWHLFFLLVCATLAMLLIALPPVLYFVSKVLWAIPQHFFWQAFLPGRSWAMTEQALRAQAQDDLDAAAIDLCLKRAVDTNGSRPVFARLIYNSIVIAYYFGTYTNFYVQINHGTEPYFSWGLNPFHTSNLQKNE